MYLLENARRLSCGQAVNKEPIEEDVLRVFYAEMLLARSRYEAGERTILRSILYPDSSRSWQVGAPPRSYAFILDTTRAKRRKLQITEIEAQTSGIEDNSFDIDSDDTEPKDLTAIKDKISTLCKPALLDPWMRYLQRFANCRVQRSRTSMGLSRAFRLLQLIAAFGCSDHFVAMKQAIAQYRVLVPAKELEQPLDLSRHLYKLGIWTESVGLINIILQRLARSYFTSLIDEGRDLFTGISSKNNAQKGHAVTKAIKALVVKIDPRLKGLDSSDDIAERTAFLEVQRNLQRWRQEGAIWSLIQKRFSSLAILLLVPHHIRVSHTGPSISESS